MHATRSRWSVLIALVAMLGVLLPPGAPGAVYTTVNSPASVNWNTAPWNPVEPPGVDQRVGLLTGGGVMEINTAEIAGGLLVGWTGSYTVNMTGGSLTLGSADFDQYLMVGTDGASTVQGIFNHSGGVVTTPGVYFNRYGACDNGIYILGNGLGTGARLQTGFVTKSHGTATFNFNGGTLQATAAGAGWFGAGIAANVQAGGAVIDTQNFDITVNSALLNGGGGGGLTKLGPGVLRLNASNTYTGTTTLDQGYLVLQQPNTLAGPVQFGTAGAYRRLDLWNFTQTFGGIVSPDNAATDIYTDPGFNATMVLNVGAGQSLYYGGTLGAQGNTFAVTKNGPGTQVLAGNNTYTGGTTVNGGTLQIGANNASTNVGASSYTLAGGSQLVFSRNADDSRFTNQSISGNGDVVFRGQQAGYFTFRQGQYTGALSYTGRTIVNLDDSPGNQWYQGTLWMERDDLLPHGTILELQSGKVFLRNSEASGQTVAGLVGTAGTFITTDRATVQKLNVEVAAGQTHTYAGGIGSGEGNTNLALTKSGPGTQVLAGPNTYTGGTTVSGGTLQIGDNNALNNVGGGNYSVAAGAKLVFSRNFEPTDFTTQSISGAGDVEFRGQQNGYFRFQNYTGALSYTGRTIVNLDDNPGNQWYQGVLWLEKDNVLPNSTVLDLQRGKIYMRNSGTVGQTVAGLTGNAGTFVTTDQGVQKLNVNVTAGQTYTYAGVIGADGTGVGNNNVALTKSGPGTQILAGDTTYIGGTTVSGGTLQFGANSAAGARPPGTVTLQNGANLALSHNYDYAGPSVPNVTGNGNLVLLGQGAGYYSIRPGQTTTLNYSGTTTLQLDSQLGSTWRGALFVEPGSVGLPSTTVLNILSGKLDLRQNQTVAGLTGTGGYVTTDGAGGSRLIIEFANSAGPYTYAGVIGAPPEPGYNSANIGLEKRGSGTQILTGANNYTGGATVLDGTLQIGAGGTSGSIGGNVTVNTPGQLMFNRSDTSTFAGGTSGSGAVLKEGGGALIVTGTLNHAGGTAVNAGTLQIGSGTGAAPLGSTNYAVADPATLVFIGNADNNLFTTQSISGAGDVVFRGQQNGYFTFRQGQYTGSLSYTGRTIVNLDDNPGNQWYQGVLWLEKDNLLPNASVLELQTGKVYMRASTVAGQTVAGLAGNAGTFITTDQGVQKLNVNVAAGQTYTYAGSIGADGTGTGNNNVALTKAGPGTQILAGPSTYTGGTTVTAGRLLAQNTTGSATGTGLVTVSGGALGGGNAAGTAGFIGGPVLITGTGALAPGNSPGILTLQNGLTFTDGAYSIEIQGNVAGTLYDQTKVTAGNVALGSGVADLVIDGTGYTPGAADLLWIFNNTGTGSTTGFFAGLPEGSIVRIAQTNFAVHYGAHYGLGQLTGGNDVALAFVPEPSTLVLMAFGGAALLEALRRRRRPAKEAKA